MLLKINVNSKFDGNYGIPYPEPVNIFYIAGSEQAKLVYNPFCDYLMLLPTKRVWDISRCYQIIMRMSCTVTHEGREIKLKWIKGDVTVEDIIQKHRYFTFNCEHNFIEPDRSTHRWGKYSYYMRSDGLYYRIWPERS